MSDLIDRNVLRAKMYQEAFESDTDMQKWDSGCWIRYKLFEKVVDSTPTVPYAPRWHSVEEPPKEEGKYLVSDGRGNYFVAWWGPRLGWCYDPKFFCYWMPIEPPKED